ncbi:MAG: hypothetical protein ABFS34_16390 [Gemmatimonadota bacterium]
MRKPALLALRRRARAGALAGLLGIAFPIAGAAQSAGEIFDEALERYSAQTQHVSAYTVVQQVMGVASETRFERREVNGVMVFVPTDLPGAEADPPNPLVAFPTLAERATLEGTESLDQGSCHRLAVDDLSGLDLGYDRLPGEDIDFEARSASFCLDTDSYMLRRMSVLGDALVQGQRQAVTLLVASDDYRSIEGVLVAFRTSMSIEGLDAFMAEGDAAQAKEALEQMRAELEKMPAAQREMVQSMMSAQLEQLEALAGGDAVAFIMTVTDVRVEKD